MARKALLLAGRWFSHYILIALVVMAFSGCAPTARSSGAQGDETPFLPPTQPILTDLTPTPDSLAGEQAAADIECQDSLSFLSDQTIPDGSLVEADATLDKRWEVENSGNCNWDEQYQVRLIAGPEMGAKKEQALFPARSGSRATIRILFQAPAEPGTYRSAWQAFNPQGESFGDPFFIDIIVGE